MRELSFEDKLKELKEEYCRFNCPVKDGMVEKVSDEDFYCENCDSYETIDYEVEIEICSKCQVGEFIRHIRDMDV